MPPLARHSANLPPPQTNPRACVRTPCSRRPALTPRVDAVRLACARQAEAAIRRFEEQTDILIVVSNDKLLEIVPDDVPCAQRVSTRRPAAIRRWWERGRRWERCAGRQGLVAMH